MPKFLTKYLAQQKAKEENQTVNTSSTSTNTGTGTSADPYKASQPDKSKLASHLQPKAPAPAPAPKRPTRFGGTTSRTVSYQPKPSTKPAPVGYQQARARSGGNRRRQIKQYIAEQQQANRQSQSNIVKHNQKVSQLQKSRTDLDNTKLPEGVPFFANGRNLINTQNRTRVQKIVNQQKANNSLDLQAQRK